MDRCVGDPLEGEVEDVPRMRTLLGGGRGAQWNGANVGEDYIFLSDGPRLILATVKNATYHRRAQLEPGAVRYFEALAMEWLGRNATPTFAMYAIE